jgi:hypothetical protein
VVFGTSKDAPSSQFGVGVKDKQGISNISRKWTLGLIGDRKNLSYFQVIQSGSIGADKDGLASLLG